ADRAGAVTQPEGLCQRLGGVDAQRYALRTTPCRAALKERYRDGVWRVQREAKANRRAAILRLPARNLRLRARQRGVGLGGIAAERLQIDHAAQPAFDDWRDGVAVGGDLADGGDAARQRLAHALGG